MIYEGLFPDESEEKLVETKVASDRISGLSDLLQSKNAQIEFLITEYFKDPDFLNSLPEEIKDDDIKLIELMLNMSAFQEIITSEREKRWSGDESGLFGEEVQIAETQHADGRARKAESGYRINVDYLKTLGIDPSKILFFRITQPVKEAKPEYYWTSDLFETKKGLTREILPEQRQSAVILVADLETINKNGGLIQDINDDLGLPVRQIGTDGFDQSNALTRIKLDK